MTTDCAMSLSKFSAFVDTAGKLYKMGLLNHKHSRTIEEKMKTRDKRSNILASQQAAIQRFQETIFWRIKKVLGGKVGWLEGIYGTISDCCALKRDFSETEAKTVCWNSQSSERGIERWVKCERTKISWT